MGDLHDRAWLEEQLQAYAASLPRLQELSRLLRVSLEAAARRLAPLAIVQTRVKAVASLAEKIQRKPRFEGDVTSRFTDLCGGRVIAPTRTDVRALGTFIEQSFEVDRKNSVDARQRLEPSEFGYRSIHYVVSLPEDAGERLGLAVPPGLRGLKAEIQLRTFPEHAWADMAHDLSYKGAFRLPARWQRELAALAALLEQADELMERVEGGLREYFSSYDAYLDAEQLAEERRRLAIVLEHDPGNAALARRIAKLAMCQGDWRGVVEVLEPFAESDEPASLRDLGVALCKLHRASGGDSGAGAHRRGQRLLERACRLAPGDVDALASLAGTYRDAEPERAARLYRQAFELDPTNPYPLSNLLLHTIAAERSLSCLTAARPAVAAAAARCRRQADAGTNLPWALYDLGFFLLLLEAPHRSLAAYARATALAADWMAATALRSLELLEPVSAGIQGYGAIRDLLRLSCARGGSGEAASRLGGLATPGAEPLRAPVVVMAGGTSGAFQPTAEALAPVLASALEGFAGTLISGGTAAGMSGLAGRIARGSSGRIRAVGYLPAAAAGDPAQLEPGYAALRLTAGPDFGVGEPLRYWSDLLAAGVRPADVVLLGAGGGEVSAAEYRIALALGARVGLVAGTGGEAEELLDEADWRGWPGLVRLPAEAGAIRELVAASGRREKEAP